MKEGPEAKALTDHRTPKLLAIGRLFLILVQSFDAAFNLWGDNFLSGNRHSQNVGVKLTLLPRNKQSGFFEYSVTIAPIDSNVVACRQGIFLLFV